jgi:hypothetical protein
LAAEACRPAAIFWYLTRKFYTSVFELTFGVVQSGS